MKKITHTTAATAAYTGEIPKTPIRFIMYISKQYTRLAFGAVIFVLVAKAAELGAVYAISQLVDDFTTATSTDMQLHVLLWGGSIVLLLAILDRIGWRVSGFFGVAWLIKADAEAYRVLYKYVSNHSHTYFSDRFAGAISNKISNAAGGSDDIIVRFLWDILPQVCAMFITLWLFVSVHWSIGLIFFLFLSAVFAFNVWRVKQRRPLVVTYAEASSYFRGKGVDLMTNIQATRQYVRRKDELMWLEDIIGDRIKKDFRQAYHGEWTMVFNGIFGILLTALVIGGAYIALTNGVVSAGQIVLVLLLVGEIGYTFNVMGQIMNGFVRKYAEIEEGLKEVLVDHEVVDATNATQLASKEGKIDWNKVSFEFGNNAVFEDFNLSIVSGQRIGLVGHSGAGKTTFVSLLLRQHDLKSGTIAIDGQDISQVTQDSLRAAIAVVPQEPLLFHRSICENIAYGKPSATDKEIEEVAKKAQAHEFITTLEQGYETLVGERGVKLSGGQKQRIAIARAMLKDAPILVLDEATSALDSESEVLIQKALHELMEGKTVIAVAHRLSTLRKMDRIIVLENGKIIEDGNHDELAEAGGTYQKLWEHQAGGFLQD